MADWRQLHASRSDTLNAPLLHSSWWGSADEGGMLTRWSVMKYLFTRSMAMWMPWLPCKFAVASLLQ